MPYGGVKFDTITFTNAGADTTTTISGLYTANLALSTGLTVTGTISGITVQGTTISGVTVTGTTANFVTGVFTSLTGTTATFTSGIIASGTAALPSLAILSDPNTGLFSPAADTLAFAEGGVEAMRIDSSGRLLVGTSTARGNNFNGPTGQEASFQIEGTSYQTSSASLTCNAISGTNNSLLIFNKSAGSSTGSNTLVADGNSLGTIHFQGNDGSEFVQAAEIRANVDGTPGANDMPGRLVFSTTADGAAGPTERMRITSAGYVGIGTTTVSRPLVLGGTSFTAIALQTSATTGTDVSDGFQLQLSGADAYVWNYENAPTIFGTNNLERARIDSSGRLLVGTSTAVGFVTAYRSGAADQVFHIENGTTAAGVDFQIAKTLKLNLVHGGKNGGFDQGWQLNSGCGAGQVTNNGYLAVSKLIIQDGSASSEVLRIDSSGRLLVGTSTANTSGAKLQTSDGLTFPAIAVASADPNTLDDYEEGTWTPVVVGTTTAGTVTHTGLVGSYTKIGNTVNFLLFCGWNSGTGTGNLQVTGLPFVANISNGRFYPGSVYTSSLTIPIGDSLSVIISSSSIIPISTPTGGGAGTAVAYDAAVQDFVVQGTYFIS